METNEDKMLRSVLSDERLMNEYGYSLEDFVDIDTALRSENEIVVAVASIIRKLKGSTDESTKAALYKEIFNYLYNNITE